MILRNGKDTNTTLHKQTHKFYNIDFNMSSRQWLKNKTKLVNGTYKYKK